MVHARGLPGDSGGAGAASQDALSLHSVATTMNEVHVSPVASHVSPSDECHVGPRKPRDRRGNFFSVGGDLADGQWPVIWHLHAL